MDIKSLKKWMKEECFNDTSYAIGQEKPLFEGFGLRRLDEGFIWYYTERGKMEILKSFTNEAEACQYAFEQMKGDKYGRSHLVGFLESEGLKEELCRELKKRQIEFECDKIHYQEGKYIHRVFVFGCDWQKVIDLKAEYEQKEPKNRWPTK